MKFESFLTSYRKRMGWGSNNRFKLTCLTLDVVKKELGKWVNYINIK